MKLTFLQFVALGTIIKEKIGGNNKQRKKKRGKEKEGKKE
jgi:hypothetical protein